MSLGPYKQLKCHTLVKQTQSLTDRPALYHCNTQRRPCNRDSVALITEELLVLFLAIFLCVLLLSFFPRRM